MEGSNAMLDWHCTYYSINPDSKVHGANMGSIWGRQDPGGSHVGPMDFVIWEQSTFFMGELYGVSSE